VTPGLQTMVNCSTIGARAGMAAQAFRASGYDAYNLGGGIQAWADRGLAMEPEGSAYVADH
jgi:rhodanese-related sulfurtransferase